MMRAGTGAAPGFGVGQRVFLRALGEGDATPAYLDWLNDSEVLRYRAPKGFPSTMTSLRRWIEGIPDRGDLVLAICDRHDGRHVGNISLNDIRWIHRSAELSIMMGAKDVWGRGYGGEAIDLLSTHGFRAMGLHRIWAESPNPAFKSVVRRLGWQHEGSKRKAFLLDGSFIDIECWGILAHEHTENGPARSC